MVDMLLQEVNADVRAERLSALWQQWRKPIAVLCVALIFGTAAGQVWQYYQQKRGAEWFAMLSVAQTRLAQGRASEAAEDFAAVAASASGDVKTIAQLWAGRALLAQGKAVEATASFKAASAAKPSLWADIGCLRLAAIDAVQAQTCLNAQATSPLKTKRQLWGAAIEAEQGKLPEAMKKLEALAADVAVSDAERAEAARWAASLKPLADAKPVPVEKADK